MELRESDEVGETNEDSGGTNEDFPVVLEPLCPRAEHPFRAAFLAEGDGGLFAADGGGRHGEEIGEVHGCLYLLFRSSGGMIELAVKSEKAALFNHPTEEI